MTETSEPHLKAHVRGVVANLGCGGPHPPPRRAWAREWLASVIGDGIDLLLLQEVPLSEALKILAPSYDIFTADASDGDHRCRSIVAVRRASGMRALPFTIETARYHGSYVAAASVRLPGAGETVIMSVHASPTRPSAQEQGRWTLTPPRPRQQGQGELWDSDFVLATIEHLVDQGFDVLAAGDFNEARSWDAVHGGTWGAEYFAGVDGAESRLGDCMFSRWLMECCTHAGYQDDHVFATAAVDALISDMCVGEEVPADGTDHYPIRFTINGY